MRVCRDVRRPWRSHRAAHRFCNQHALDVAALVPSNLTDERSRHPKSRPPLSSRRDKSRRRMMTNRWINQPRFTSLRSAKQSGYRALPTTSIPSHSAAQAILCEGAIRPAGGETGSRRYQGSFPSRRGGGKVLEATVANRYYSPLKQDQQYMFATFGASPSSRAPVRLLQIHHTQ
jgi:hypothetical protein